MTGRFVLATPRLLLREMEHEDLDFVAAMLAHPDVMRHYPKSLTRDEARAWIDRMNVRYARDGHALWLVVRREDDLPVGQVGLMVQPVDGREEREIGWLLDRPFWGLGYATEAAAAVRDWAFATYDPPRLISLIRPANLSSQAVARRIGMEPASETTFAGAAHIVFATAR